MSDDGSYEKRLAQLDADLNRLVRRLGSLTSHSWRPREAAVRELAQSFADLDARLDGRPPRPVPALPVYGLADVIAVLGGDVVARLAAGAERDVLGRAAELVEATLRETI